jgi:PAS domain S-box-containing protein
MSARLSNEFIASLIDPEELYQNAPCGYFSFLPDGTIIKANKTLLGWLGFEETDLLLNRKFTDLIVKGGIIYYEMIYLPSIKIHGEVNEINYQLARKDGTSFPALVNSRAIFGESKHILAVNATVYDITDRKKYEATLLKSRREAETETKKFEFMANLIPEMIWTAAPNGELDYINDRYFSYFNTTEKKLEADFLLKKVHPEDKGKLLRRWLLALRSLKTLECEVRIANRFNEYHWHLIRANGYQDEFTQVTKWFGSCYDINDQVVSLERKDEFIHIASHELKTPVTGLKAYNQLLLRSNKVEGRDREFLEKSAHNISNLHFLISSLLDVSQINAGQLTLAPSRFCVVDLVKAAVETIQITNSSHRMATEISIPEDIFITADRPRLMQVLINLLSNAIKYSPNADQVLIRLFQNPNYRLIHFEIIDFGLGIPNDKLDKIFDKYYRVSDSKNNNRASGLGLGLYIIQNIVKLHGSNIQVTSEVNKGSTFSFTLPIAE